MSAPLLPEDGPQRSQSWRQFEDEARRLRPTAASESAAVGAVRVQAWGGEDAGAAPESAPASTAF